MSNLSSRVRELRRLESVESMEQDMVPHCERLLRRLKFLNMERRGYSLLVIVSYTCTFCGKNTVKRSCVGIWECRKCGKVVAGGAWSISTPTALTVRSSIHRLRRAETEA